MLFGPHDSRRDGLGDVFLRIDGDQSQAKVLVVLLTKAFFRSIPCLKEVDAAVQKGDIYIIPIRVESEENYDVSRDKKKMWPIDVTGDDV
jgi:hypothetical protein